MSKLSIVVPAFNAENYLHKMLDCLVNQTYKDKEIIIVDDGSTDNTPNICEEYATLYSSVQVIHKSNEGTGAARNTGLDASSGEYVAFVDADDCIDYSAYEMVMNFITSTESDVAAFGFVKEYTDDFAVNKNSPPVAEPVVIEGKYDILKSIGSEINDLAGYVWNKVFKKSAIGSIKFNPQVPIVEDTVFVYQVLNNCNKAVYVNYSFYHYRYVATSISQAGGGKTNKFLRALNGLDDLNAWADKNTPQCSESLGKNFIFWNVKTCEQMLKDYDRDVYNKVKNNLNKYDLYISKCGLRIRILASAAKKSWRIYRPLGILHWNLKKLYVRLKRIHN